MTADCRARCVDGADLGVDEYAGHIAHADPRCPVHGEPEAVMAYIAALEQVAEAARPVVDPSALSPSLVARMGDLATVLTELDKED